MVCKLFALGVRHFSLIFQIFFVAHKNTGNVLIRVLVDLSHPLRDLGEGVSVSDVVGHDDTVSTLVVAAGNSLEPLLPGGVPNLQLDSLAVYVNSSDFEIYSDSWHEVVVEDVILYELGVRAYLQQI